MSAEKVLQGRCIVEGCVEGEALVTNDAISFMGTINPKTGYVIERKHLVFLVFLCYVTLVVRGLVDLLLGRRRQSPARREES